MKKLTFILCCITLSGCDIVFDHLFNNTYIPKEIVNPECNIRPDGIYTVQVLDNGVLGKPLEYYKPDYKTIDKEHFQKPDYDTQTIYISTSKDDLKNKFDEAAFGFDETACLKSDGTYSYTTTFGSKKTIQKFKIIWPRYIPNPNYIEKE